MAQPWRHPKTNVWYFRKVVPQHLRKAVGQTEIRISLGTKNLADAKRKWPEVAAQVQARFDSAGGQKVSLSQQQIAALAGLWYRRMLEEYEENPGEADGWQEWTSQLSDAGHEDRISDVVKRFVDPLLEEEGLNLDEASRAKLDEAIFWNALKVAKTLEDRSLGDYSPDKFLETVPAWKSPKAKANGADQSFEGLLTAWKAERKPVERTYYEWKRAVDRLAAHVGHDQPARVSTEDVVKWKDALLASGKSPKTVRNHLFAVHALFEWARKNRRMATNPASGVEVAAKEKAGAKKRLPYTDDDAKLLLQAARREEGAKRWVPWLLAYTGARLEEVCQSFASDIRQEKGIWYLDINADHPTKTLKNAGSARKVPLHPAIIKEEFLRYVQELPKGSPLFPDLSPDRFGRRGGNGTKIIGRWVRGLGITDPRKAPNHSWRHRFKDLCRAVSIEKSVHDALTGHASGDVGDSYGLGYPLERLAREIKKIRFQVD